MIQLERLAVAALCTFTLIASVSAQSVGPERYDNWHQWRGPDATGSAARGNPPTTWSETENVQWKAPLEGAGSSTPIVWKDQVFVLTSINTGEVDPNATPPSDQPDRPFGIKFPNTKYRFVVLSFDRNTGEELWRQTATELVPHEGHHGDNNFASASPTTDGERLYCWFGSAGMFCFDLQGQPLWKRNLGPVETRRNFGEGYSPVAHEGRVVINRDHEGQSSIHVLDAKTGETLWTAERDEPSAWATPLVVEHNGVTQVVTSATNRVRSYNLADGSLIWECGGQVGNVIPSPVTDGEFVYCMSGYRGSAAYAIPLSARGDITGTDQVRWSMDRGTPYVPSPLLHKGLLYFNQSNNAILTCVEAATGDVVIDRTRIDGLSNMYASPVGVEDRVYFVGRDGRATVLKHGAPYTVIAENKLDDAIDASPAIVGRQLFLRGAKHLYCLAEPAAEANGLPAKENFHLYVLAGQSNMAGRGKVEAQDKQPHDRVMVFNREGRWVPAVDPLHWDKSSAGVGLGKTFGEVLAEADENVTIGLIPIAAGGSPISTWEPGGYHGQTKSHPWDDGLKHIQAAMKNGTLKAVLWHQGESDSSPELAPKYEEKLTALINRFRTSLNDPDLPFVIGQLGQFEERPWNEPRRQVDAAQRAIAEDVPHTAFVPSDGLTPGSDKIHFDSRSLREFGRRYAAAYQKLVSAEAE